MATLIDSNATDTQGPIKALFDKLEAEHPRLHSQERIYGWALWTSQDARMRGEQNFAMIVCHDDERDGPNNKVDKDALFLKFEAFQ